MSEVAEESDRLEGAPHPRDAVNLHGQAAAERAFLGALAAGRPHHAWLIAGPRGVGKATLAWRIARHMLAGAPAGGMTTAPGDPAVRRAGAQVHVVRRPWDDKAKRLKTAIGVDEVRGLKGLFQMSAPDAGWRVAIVDAVDELTPQAANALLKTLEEPPARGLLLLVCHQPARVLPTIRSRCRMLRCAPLEPDDLTRALADAGVDAGPAPALRTLAGGSVGEAIRLLAQDGPALYATIAGLLAEAPPLDRRRALALADSCAGREATGRTDAALGLMRLALARLARAAAGAPVEPVCAAEARAFARLAAHPAQARLWAETAPRLAARAERARAAHLDPAQVILDMLLQIDAAAAEARAVAA